jgi:hypothetical protein
MAGLFRRDYWREFEGTRGRAKASKPIFMLKRQWERWRCLWPIFSSHPPRLFVRQARISGRRNCAAFQFMRVWRNWQTHQI